MLQEALEQGHHALVEALLDHTEEHSALSSADADNMTVARLVQSLDMAALFKPKPPGKVPSAPRPRPPRGPAGC